MVALEAGRRCGSARSRSFWVKVTLIDEAERLVPGRSGCHRAAGRLGHDGGAAAGRTWNGRLAQGARASCSTGRTARRRPGAGGQLAPAQCRGNGPGAAGPSGDDGRRRSGRCGFVATTMYGPPATSPGSPRHPHRQLPGPDRDSEPAGRSAGPTTGRSRAVRLTAVASVGRARTRRGGGHRGRHRDHGCGPDGPGGRRR